MKRMVTSVMVIALTALSAFSLPLEWWDMDDSAGTDLNELANSGSLGSRWNYNTDGHATDGNGLFVLSGDAGVGTTTRKLPRKGTANAEPTGENEQYASPITNGAYSLDLNCAAWSFDAASEGDALKLKAQDLSGNDLAGIEIGVNSGEGRIRTWSMGDGHSYYRTYACNLIEADGADVSVEFDFDNDTINYIINGSTTHSFTDFTGTELGGLVYAAIGDGTDDWATSASSISIDSMGVDSLTAEEGDDVYVASQQFATTDTTPTTNNFSFSVNAGDMVAVLAASNKGLDPTSNTVSFSGTAVLGSTGFDDQSAGPHTAYWYAPVQSNGSVDVEYGSVEARTVIAAYHLGAADGEEVVVLDADKDGTTETNELSVSYSFSGAVTGVCLEAFSTYSDVGVPLAPETSETVTQGNRLVGIGEFIATNTLVNTWTNGPVANNAAIIGLFFDSVGIPVHTPSSLYNDWLDGETINTNLLEDVDSDGVNNLTDYAIGGAANLPVSANDGNYLTYVHIQWDDTEAAARGLSYEVQATGDLLSPSWATNGVERVNSVDGIPAAGYTTVTNRIPTTNDTEFVKLNITFQNP